MSFLGWTHVHYADEGKDVTFVVKEASSPQSKVGNLNTKQTLDESRRLQQTKYLKIICKIK